MRSGRIRTPAQGEERSCCADEAGCTQTGAATVGAGQAIQALGAGSPASLRELGGGCGGGSAAVRAVVAAHPRPQASRTRPEAGRAALL